MDKNVAIGLYGIPADALHLVMTRSTIRMHHDVNWRVEKSVDQHDLVVCLTGRGEYVLNGQRVSLSPGEGMLIPAGSHFRGWRATGGLYTGIAQHFRLDLFNEVDLLSQMELHITARFRRWEMMEPVVQYYRSIAPQTTTNLIQQHMFMFILLEFLDAAFVRWREQALINTAGSDALSLHIMLMAADISRDPMNEQVVEQSLERRPYNPDYLTRAFRDKIGHTPRRFRELKRMEYAMSLLATGHSVKQTAARTGYADPLYFSRQFRKLSGTSPSAYRLSRRHIVEGEANADHPDHTRGTYTSKITEEAR
ncbi:MAG: helix-turn-helix transcriptional regulator [Alphaproteobacteria bacterium]|nr:helix-turn-helix transcriptional regulator [Alphaproteobacteria bacterium]